MKKTSHIFHSDDLQNLREEMHRALDLRLDKFQNQAQLIEIFPTNGKIDWLKGEAILYIFYQLLFKHKYINCDWKFFKIHFIGKEATIDKIVFLKATNQLPYIMKRLEGNGFISKCKHTHIRLAQHFLDRFGKPMNNKVLRASLNKSVSDKNKEFIDEKIIDMLTKHPH